MPHAAWFQLQNILEKAKWWKQKKDQELQDRDEQAEHRGFSGQWKHSTPY